MRAICLAAQKRAESTEWVEPYLDVTALGRRVILNQIMGSVCSILGPVSGRVRGIFIAPCFMGVEGVAAVASASNTC